MPKLNGTATWIMTIITAVSLMFGLMSGVFGRGLSKMKAIQNEDHTEIQLLKQELTQIGENVKDIHKVIYKPSP